MKEKTKKSTIITTSNLKPKSQREKKTILQTHDLPSPLPIQQPKEQKEKEEKENEEK